MNAVMYGAGNIGRGFIGQLFAQSGCEVTFIDVNGPLVEALNREGRYPLRILSGNGGDDTGGFDGGGETGRAEVSAGESAAAGETRPGDIWIEGVRAVHGADEHAAAEAIAGADIMATAVGVRALPLIAPVIAAGLTKRFARNSAPLNIIICENLIDAAKVLARLVKERLGADARKIFDERVGLVEASVGRMVPVQTEEMRDGNPLRVCVEAYGFLPVDKAAFKGPLPSLAGLCLFDDFEFYTQRKIFIHNMGHAICAYLGMFRGDTYIHETVRHHGILFIAENAMLESALALSAKYRAPLPGLYRHIKDLLRRFSNRALGDTCARVGADTGRKLGKQDRLIGALLFCAKEGVTPAFISAGAAAALHRRLKENGLPQNRDSARAVLAEVSGLAEDSPETERILSFHSMLASTRASAGDFEDSAINIIKAALDADRGTDII